MHMCIYMLFLIMYHGVRTLIQFGVLWFDYLDSGASSWFHMGIDEALLKVLVEIWCIMVPWCGFRNEYLVLDGNQ